MFEESVESKYYFKLNIMGLSAEQLDNYQIFYKRKKKPLNEIINKEINNERELLQFIIFRTMNSDSYVINLTKDKKTI